MQLLIYSILLCIIYYITVICFEGMRLCFHLCLSVCLTRLLCEQVLMNCLERWDIAWVTVEWMD